ncbi:MAG: PadR family transcriptional regulator [Candidatus Bathyarchaeota archaeon]|nr:PadR family transcriptional regulator [Candidatus Bathyarchaeota archaeon]
MTYVPESFKKGIVRRIFRNFLDVMVLRLVQIEPMWGYKIIKRVEEQYEITLRHGALYPLLNNLEKKGFLRSRKEAKGGRVRKVYEITSKGIQLVEAYNEFLQNQLAKQKNSIRA